MVFTRAFPMPKKPKALDAACVTVSTTEKPVVHTPFACPPHVAEGLTEQKAINALVKWYGWRGWEPGQLVRVEDARRAA